MCTCNYEPEPTEEYLTAHSEFDPSVSEGTSWRSAVDTCEEDVCSPDCFSASTPKSQRNHLLQQAHLASLRNIAARPDLAVGVAVARRLFDPYDTFSDLDDTDTVDDPDVSMLPLDESQIRRTIPRRPNMASPTIRHCEPCRLPIHDRTYELRGARRQRSPPVSRQLPPRMTRLTPCGKCLRM